MTERINKLALRNKLTQAREALTELISNLDESQWQVIVYSEGEEWRVSDIIRHLVSSESGMMATIENIRGGGYGVPEDFDLARWNARTVDKMADSTPNQMQEDMVMNRRRLFALIDDLSDEDLSKSGRHASLRIMTIQEILEMIADHETTHTQDITTALL